MDRRQFLRSFGAGVAGGVVAHATGADVGLWADMMAWLKGPQRAYSIPSTMGIIGRHMDILTYDDIDAISIEHMRPYLIDIFSKPNVFRSWRGSSE